jgi:hypothetical protein
MSTRPIQVWRVDDASAVPATLSPALSAVEFAMAESTWVEDRHRIRRALMERKAPFTEWPESLHWDWMAKSALLRRLEVTGMGIIADDTWQALMLTKSASHFTRMGVDRGRPLVYVDYVEVAPWNWAVSSLGQRPRYRGLGSLLLVEAVRQSFAEGFHGRVGLHALPQSEGFYQSVCGFTPVEVDPEKQNLLYLELSRENARLLLEKGRTR